MNKKLTKVLSVSVKLSGEIISFGNYGKAIPHWALLQTKDPIRISCPAVGSVDVICVPL
jgi:hypothetical protein